MGTKLGDSELQKQVGTAPLIVLRGEGPPSEGPAAPGSSALRRAGHRQKVPLTARPDRGSACCVPGPSRPWLFIQGCQGRDRVLRLCATLARRETDR